ncbi:GTP-binding protein EngA [Candidatus Ornithobacterium hominis]|uniref:GTPase Der n=1 Tax=Candidatus Ornithobacterium hominis TaxID=2497989 RepID=A0A383U4H9_9FLAO|nr:ribosome biogenesis GTPase Der [Candidatus Ornithobacterium hominis]MCT7904597.1 ribosome biogenesis GTPase Der [Candidatus Ornithobacterium hominis]CAI9429682.1 ribosome biogenesis GTPase Der [Candidatus Ornithobacterium hominis]SZD73726.1 GTP-binding protein EngA [Candidatus Ornithobacterium hominis]SZD74061.1 GTP-binding protein EngA [Candidatus Ornithobacterium hominis]
MSNIVAIVGRPNVGKSTLFNRLLQKREAIVDSVSGVTRDRHYGKSDWNGRDFTVIDTGGYIEGSDDVFEGEIRKQVELAIQEATVIIFVVDNQVGVTSMDKRVALLLHQKTNKPVFLVVNKVDSNKNRMDAVEFYELGFSEYYTISAIQGSGTGDLLDAIVEKFPEEKHQDPFDGLPKITIAGRPNAGKSTFTNALLGEERNIVTDIAGTTRDSIETLYNKFGHEFVLIDTAGMRKKSKVEEDLEFYAVMRAIRAIEDSDVVILMIDAERGVESQDMKIFNLAQKNRKGIVILINKWDLVEKETNTMRDMEKMIKQKISPFTDVPILFISALSKQRIHKTVEVVMEVYQNRSKRIKTSQLNEWLLPLVKTSPPPAVKGKYIKIKYITQLPTKTPQFALFCNLPQYVRDPYKRFVENKLREKFNFSGVPIQIYFRKK